MAQHEDGGARPPGDSGENAARELLAILGRGKWTVLAVFLIVTGVVTFAAVRSKPLYEAESSLMVRIGREYVYRPEVGRTETARTPSLSEMVNSEVEILSSRDLAEQVVRELGVEKLYPEVLELESDPRIAAEKAVLRFRAAASIRPVLESSVIKVGFEHEVPELAAQAVNRLVERFKDKHIEVFGEERSGRLEEQHQMRIERLAQAELALAEFKRKNGVFDLDQQRVLLLDRRERLDGDLRACETELSELRQRMVPEEGAEPLVASEPHPYLRPEMKQEILRQKNELERELRELDPPTSDRLIEEASLRLLDLELEESQLLRDFSSSNRKVESVRAEMQRVRVFLEGAERRAGSFEQAHREQRLAAGQELKAEVARLTTELELLVREEERLARLETLQRIQVLETQRQDTLARVADLDLEVRTLDQQEQPLRKLERELVAAESAAQTYLERVDEARITEELDRERRINVRVIEKAAAPVAPSGLPLKLKLAIGAFVGLVAGVGVAVLLDLFRAR